MKNPYTPEDAGCYVDSARGIYSTDFIVDFARNRGATITQNCECRHDDSHWASEFASCEFANEYEDEADNYMNEHYPIEGHYWGRSEHGDWGLWPIDED